MELWELLAQIATAGAAIGALGISGLSWKASREVPERVQRLQAEQTNTQWLREQKINAYMQVMLIHAKAQEQLLRANNQDEHADYRRFANQELKSLLAESKELQSRVFILSNVRIKILGNMFHSALGTATNASMTSDFPEEYHTFQAVSYILNDDISKDLGAETFGSEEDYDIERSMLRDEIQGSVMARLQSNPRPGQVS